MPTLDLSDRLLIEWLKQNTINTNVDEITYPTELDLTNLKLTNNDLDLDQYTT